MNATASPRTIAPDAGAAADRAGLLRLALRLDAVVTAANAVAYLAAAGPLSDLLGLDAAFLRAIGAGLLAFSALVWIAGARAVPRTAAVRAIVAVNAAWVAAGLALAVLGLGSPSTAGTVWAILQAGVVGGLAELQVAGLRRGR